MDYGTMIEKIMPFVEDSSALPFIVSRNNGEWELDYLDISPEKAAEYLASMREKDPCAVQFTGQDFSHGSMPFVYDKVLTERLRAEFDAAQLNKDGAFHALLVFMEDNISEFSQDVTNHLTDLDRPLAMLYRMDLPDLYSYTSEYDKDNAQEAIDVIENRVAELRSRKNEEVMRDMPEKRVIEGYTELVSIQIAGKVVVLAEKPDDEQPYLICNIKWDNPLNFEERYNGVVTDNYIEALRIFISRQSELVDSLEAERIDPNLPIQTMTAADCLPGSNNADWEGKAVIIKPESLAPEYRSAEHQIVLCTGGFGARPDSSGRKVYIKELNSGKECYYQRFQIAGIADPSKLPAWAADKLTEHTKAQEHQAAQPPDKQSLPKKPTLHDKLEKAKQKEAANNRDNRSDKPKKRDDKEV